MTHTCRTRSCRSRRPHERAPHFSTWDIGAVGHVERDLVRIVAAEATS
ncbi:hypothetical protein [Actinophytocola sp.]